MARHILGIDIGSYSVKAVLAKEKFGRFEFMRFIEKTINGNNVQEIIASLLQEENLHPDMIVSSIPGNSVSIHYLTIPFSDETRIKQVLPYEVESITPFPIEDMIIDQFILSKMNGKAPDGGSSVVVALIKKDILRQYIENLKEAKIDPEIIELEPLSLYHTFIQWYKTEDTIGLLDIGGSRSNLCIVRKGKPALIRTFKRGGDQVTTAIMESPIMESPGIDFDEADKKKTILHPEESENEHILSEVIKKGLSPLVNELRQTLHAFEIQYDEPVSRIYLSGGGTLLHNIDQYLSEELGITIEFITPPQEELQRLPEDRGRISIFLTAIGLVLRGRPGRKAIGLNFRKGEYFHKKETKEIRGKLIYMGIALLVLIILAGTDFYMRYHYRVIRYRDIKSGIRKLYIETFPGAKNIVDEVQQLKSAVEELKKKVVALGGGKEGISSIALLKAISEKIPEDIKVNIDDFLLDKSRIRIQGDTASFENVERIKRELEKIPFFKNVVVGDAKLAADQKRVKFRIIADISEDKLL